MAQYVVNQVRATNRIDAASKVLAEIMAGETWNLDVSPNNVPAIDTCPTTIAKDEFRVVVWFKDPEMITESPAKANENPWGKVRRHTVEEVLAW